MIAGCPSVDKDGKCFGTSAVLTEYMPDETYPQVGKIFRFQAKEP